MWPAFIYPVTHIVKQLYSWGFTCCTNEIFNINFILFIGNVNYKN